MLTTLKYLLKILAHIPEELDNILLVYKLDKSGDLPIAGLDLQLFRKF